MPVGLAHIAILKMIEKTKYLLERLKFLCELRFAGNLNHDEEISSIIMELKECGFKVRWQLLDGSYGGYGCNDEVPGG